MHRTFIFSVTLGIAIGWATVAAWANPVSSIGFPDGKVLNILGTVGSGPNTAYLDIDFSNNAPAGPAYAWQYNWSGSASETNMLDAVAAANSNLSIIWDTTFAGVVDNFNYGSNIGSADTFAPTNYSYWASNIGTYDSTDATYASTQNVNWVYAPLGSDDLTLGEQYDDEGNLLNTGVQGLLYGWTINGEFQTTNLTPDLPEVAVPEPASVSLLALAGIGLLRRRRRV